MSADIGVKSTDLFRPPPEPEFFSGLKRRNENNPRSGIDKPCGSMDQWFFRSGENLPSNHRYRLSFPASACL